MATWKEVNISKDEIKSPARQFPRLLRLPHPSFPCNSSTFLRCGLLLKWHLMWKPQGKMPAASLGVNQTLSRGLQEWGGEGWCRSKLAVTRRGLWRKEQRALSEAGLFSRNALAFSSQNGKAHRHSGSRLGVHMADRVPEPWWHPNPLLQGSLHS